MLDPFQSAAAHTAEGAYLILAGPGSGKTTMLLERVLYLIREKHIPPEKLLLITFTRDAAAEMALRFRAGCEGVHLPVHFSTFHSFFFQILKKACGYRPEQILSGAARHELMLRCLFAIGENVSPTDTGYFENLEKELSRIENAGAFWKKEPEVSPDFTLLSPERFFAFRERFTRAKRESGVLDFDDMQSLCLSLLLSNDAERAFWQDRFSFYMVDESQDMNRMQYEILRILTRKRGNVFAVGDDDQSIYGFRGADPKVLKRFSKEYAGCEILYLKMNYRSDTAVIDAATRVIGHNGNRFLKEFLPHSKEEGILRFRETRTREEEVAEIVNRIQSRVKNGRVTEETAILYRSNRQGIAFAKALKEAGIDGVSLHTFHGAKGLEYDTVFIPDASERICPSNSAKDKDALEEERRMFYVALTRARHRLYLYTPRIWNGKAMYPSRFVGEI